MLNNNGKLSDDFLDSVSGGKEEESFSSCPSGCIEVKEPSWPREGKQKKCGHCGSEDLEDGSYWFADTHEVADGQRCRKCGAAWLK